MDIYHIGFDVGYRDGRNKFTAPDFSGNETIGFDNGIYGWSHMCLTSLTKEDLDMFQLGYDEGNNKGYEESHKPID